MRVYELARELKKESKVLLKELEKLKIKKTATSSLTQEQISLLRKSLASESQPPARPKPLKEKAPAPKKEVKKAPEEVPSVPQKFIQIDETITVNRLAEKLEIKVNELIKKLLEQGIMATINQRLDVEIATLAAHEFGYDVKVIPLYGEESISEEEEGEVAKPRPPVVTVMGHVDHGKTSLLDAIRETRVTARESGGMTQHIGAYEVETGRGKIVFLDTPGHEAFTAMRARGAQITDIVVLVVAADDSIMPQTIEAIDHAKAAGVPIVVAINKIDLPTANPDRVKHELSNYNLVCEEWGGKTIVVEVSAKQKVGIDKLLEMILLEAELLELKARTDTPAQGTIIEARLDRQKGPVATVLIQKGILGLVHTFISGSSWGKVRAMFNDRGKRIKEAGPSTPALVLGFNTVPQAGDRFQMLNDEQRAREISEVRQRIKKEEETAKKTRITLEDLHRQILDKKLKELKVIIKADVQGSVEALCDSLEGLSTSEIKLNVIHRGAGGINDGDVMLASASNAIIIGFNVRPEPSAFFLAQKEAVDIHTYRIIYEVIDQVKKAMEGLLEPEFKEKTLGRLEVKQVFKVPKGGMVAGCMVREGRVQRPGQGRVLRDSVIIHEGKITSLKRFKEDVREVVTGYECGVGMEGCKEFKTGDIIEVYILEKVPRKLEKKG